MVAKKKAKSHDKGKLGNAFEPRTCLLHLALLFKRVAQKGVVVCKGVFLPWPARAGFFERGAKWKKSTHTNTRTTNTADCAHVNPPVRRLYPFRFLARPALCESIKVSGRIKNELSCERYFVTATGGSTRN